MHDAWELNSCVGGAADEWNIRRGVPAAEVCADDELAHKDALDPELCKFVLQSWHFLAVTTRTKRLVWLVAEDDG